MKKLFRKFLKDESGATMVEYALLVALISVAAVAVIVLLGPLIVGTFQSVLDAMTPVVPGG
jgi:pilus assembly protein Flp/PilA